MINKQILVVAANLKKRDDRRIHFLNQFSTFSEFTLSVTEAIEDKSGAVGLWKTMKVILRNVSQKNIEYFIFCEDDHLFTSDFSFDLLEKSIEEAKNLKADVLLGGVSWFDCGVQISERLFWIQNYSGNQFIIIFREFFNKLLEHETFSEKDAMDHIISRISPRKFLMSPFISTQKDFGYSDVTQLNNHTGRVDYLFETSKKKVELLKKVKRFYSERPAAIDDINNVDEFIIPLYQINIVEDEVLHPSYPCFADKEEFELFLVNSSLDNYWHTIQQCVQSCLDKGDDVLIICNENHSFTKGYDKRSFIENILLAHAKKCQILLGGLGSFNNAVVVSPNLMWIDHFFYSNFMVLYRGCFEKILVTDNDKTKTVEDILSQLTSQKMVLYPFISTQKTTQEPGTKDGIIDPMSIIAQQYEKAEQQLSIYKSISETYATKVVE